MATASRPAPATYRRRLIHSRDASSDRSGEVWWVQGYRFFCDARFHVDAHLADARFHVDAHPGQLHPDPADSRGRTFHLGFAGELVSTNNDTGEVEWVHAITAGESFGSVDVGRLFEVPGWGLLEVGLDLGYVELWQRGSDEPEPVWESYGIDSRGVRGVAVCVGDRFGLALGEDTEAGRPASVHIGTRDGPDWRASHSSWSTPEPPQFSISPQADGGFAVSWRNAPNPPDPLYFHPVDQGAQDD